MQNLPWLRPYTWDRVVQLNMALCASKAALHKPTSDGYETTRAMWEAAHTAESSLMEALRLCRRAHKGAPFVNFNGNTFVAIARQAVQDVLSRLGPREAVGFRSQVGHYVAGVLGQEEITNTLRTLGLLPHPPADDTPQNTSGSSPEPKP